jgi:hypothetical protein
MISIEFQQAFLQVNNIKMSLLGSNEKYNELGIIEPKNLCCDTGMEESDISKGNTEM